MLSPERISDLLNGEVNSASARLTEATRNVDAMISEVPGTLPHPDRLTKAIQEKSRAREVLERALERHTAFALYGIVPKDIE